MDKPTLQEVKEYFKNAKEVRCLFDNKAWDISNFDYYFDNEDGSFWVAKTENSTLEAELFSDGSYAKILSQIQPEPIPNDVLKIVEKYGDKLLTYYESLKK